MKPGTEVVAQDGSVSFASAAALQTAGGGLEIGTGLVSYSTLSTTLTARVITENYDTGPSTGCVLFQRGVNDVYRLSGRDRQYAVRVSRSNWRSQEQIVDELTALEFLSENGLAVARPVRRRDGGWITLVQAPEGIRRAVVFEWARGRTPKYTDSAHAHLYGRTVAQLHAVGDILPRHEARPRMDLESLLEQPLTLISEANTLGARWESRLRSLGDRITDQLSKESDKLVDWGFCHGDLHAGNAALCGDRIVLFDFDSCGLGWRIYDLASYRWDARRQGFESPAWSAFVEGYLSIRPEAVPSLQLAGPFTVLRHLWVTAQWILLSVDTGIAALGEEFFERLVPLCERIVSEDTALVA